MWIFCKQGYFSAVQHIDKPDTILLRARFPGDLERLFPTLNVANPPKIEHTPQADYAYRTELNKEAWADLVWQIAAQIDYTNFKSKVHEGHDSPRNNAYMDCWAALRSAQEQANQHLS